MAVEQHVGEEPPIYELHEVSVTYEQGMRTALRDIQLTVLQGEWLWVTGAGEAGKTSLCTLLCGVLQSRPGVTWQGSMRYAGRDLAVMTPAQLAGEVGIVFQNYETGLIHEIVADDLAFGPENLCLPPQEIEQRIERALHAIDMVAARSRRIAELSGGQRQRISIASVLTMEPRVLILDDALANLDAAATEQLLTALHTLHRRGFTIIMTTARLDHADDAHRIIALEQGTIVADGLKGELVANHLDLLNRLGVYRDSDASIATDLDDPDQAKAIQGQASHNHESQAQASQYQASQPLLEVRQLNYSFEQGKRTSSRVTSTEHTKQKLVLNNINFTLHAGDMLAVRGANGSGKTTLGKLIARLLPPPEQSIMLHGACIKQCDRSAIGYVFQNVEHTFVADTVLDECLFGLRAQRGAQKSGDQPKRGPLTNEQMITEGEKWLDPFGLLPYRDLHPQQLSAAHKQLLALASVLILQPDVVVLDEPTAGLSYVQTDVLMGLCAAYAAEGKAFFIITHDDYVIERWTTKQLILD